jgi:hypothetical protein
MRDAESSGNVSGISENLVINNCNNLKESSSMQFNQPSHISNGAEPNFYG